MSLLYIICLNLALLGFAYYHDKMVGALKKEIEELKAPKTTRRKVAVKARHTKYAPALNQ